MDIRFKSLGHRPKPFPIRTPTSPSIGPLDIWPSPKCQVFRGPLISLGLLEFALLNVVFYIVSGSFWAALSVLENRNGRKTKVFQQL